MKTLFFINILLCIAFFVLGIYTAFNNYGYIAFLLGLFSANFFNQVLKMSEEFKNKKL